MNTVGISSNALFGNSANNFLEPLSWCKAFINIRSWLLIRLPFCFCLCKNYVNADAQCAGVDILAGVSKLYAHALLLAMLATAIFNHHFIKSNISAMDRLVVAKFHINIANGWLFMIQRKIMAIILWTCLGGPFFPDTVYVNINIQNSQYKTSSLLNPIAWLILTN